MCRCVFTLQVSEDIHYSSCINIQNLGLCWSNCNMSHVLSACREHVWLVCLSELAHVHISHCRFQKLCKIVANSCVNFRNWCNTNPCLWKGVHVFSMLQDDANWTVVQHWRHHTHKPMAVWWCKTMCVLLSTIVSCYQNREADLCCCFFFLVNLHTL